MRCFGKTSATLVVSAAIAVPLAFGTPAFAMGGGHGGLGGLGGAAVGAAAAGLGAASAGVGATASAASGLNASVAPLSTSATSAVDVDASGSLSAAPPSDNSGPQSADKSNSRSKNASKTASSSSSGSKASAGNGALGQEHGESIGLVEDREPHQPVPELCIGQYVRHGQRQGQCAEPIVLSDDGIVHPRFPLEARMAVHRYSAACWNPA